MQEDFFGQSYDIKGDDGKLFCRCRQDKNGNITMDTGHSTITMASLQQRVYNPEERKPRKKKMRKNAG